ncbi:fumarylacetoacetate hydrolase family protein [Sporosarcina thermotolerans]|uniref:Fumarylacetoacetate hydrolase family protein n=1 Tax=Sporosarcina thermotolerans TaxID=633404 RepID=A0AAW9A3K0_9BACL|nr:fumarylacetoacetate hydrolase family protein [Sporosarcina thermotolerans]MDW0115407.1 fumarylacetoacetate hydrolase family protein [Sporosarcina thermotolerans]WHT47263.1 fumarylacetoacetate hydrolase family protein [Sporosarcina thermotolerans]
MKARLKVLGSQVLSSVDVNPATNSVTLLDGEVSLDDHQIDNPITGTVFGTLLNYIGELESLGDAVYDKPYGSPPIAPVLYIKPANTYNRNGGSIPMPKGLSNLRIGAALGLVIGKQAIALDEENALTYVAGYTIVNDTSVPHDSVYRPAVQHQARDGFCSIGPWIVDHHEVKNPDDLVIRVFINEKLQQENSTSNLIRPVSRLLADVTEFMTLSPGDVLLVGVPENAPLVQIGDKIRIEIEGIGNLENVIVDEKETKWRELI